MVKLFDYFVAGETVMKFVTSERPIMIAKPTPGRVSLAEFTRLLRSTADDLPTARPDAVAPEPERNVATYVAAAMSKARAT